MKIGTIVYTITEEAEVVFNGKFLGDSPTIQIDILSDLIADLKDLHDYIIENQNKSENPMSEYLASSVDNRFAIQKMLCEGLD